METPGDNETNPKQTFWGYYDSAAAYANQHRRLLHGAAMIGVASIIIRYFYRK